MRLSRIIMALMVGLAVLAAPTAAGAAQPQPLAGMPQPPVYPPPPASLAVSTPTVALGQTVILTGTNFAPNEVVLITVTSPQGGTSTLRVTADGAGSFRTTFVPDQSGVYTFRAVGQTSGKVASTTLNVTGQQPQPPPLPVTGDNVSTPMKIGGGLVGAGAVLLLLSLVWRQRHRFGIGAAR